MPRITTTKKSLGDRVADAADRVGQGVNQFMNRQAQMAQLKQQQEELAMRKKQMIAQREAQAKQVKMGAINGIVAMQGKFAEGGQKAAEAMKAEYQQMHMMAYDTPLSDDDFYKQIEVDGKDLSKMSSYVTQGLGGISKLPTNEGKLKAIDTMIAEVEAKHNFFYTPSKNSKKGTIDMLKENRKTIANQMMEEEKAKGVGVTGEAVPKDIRESAVKQQEAYTTLADRKPSRERTKSFTADTYQLMNKAEMPTGGILGKAEFQLKKAFNNKQIQQMNVTFAQLGADTILRIAKTVGAKGIDTPDEAARYIALQANENYNPELIRALLLHANRGAAYEDAKYESMREYRSKSGGTFERYDQGSVAGLPSFANPETGEVVVAQEAPEGFIPFDEAVDMIDVMGDTKDKKKKRNRMQAAPTTQKGLDDMTEEELDAEIAKLSGAL